MISSSREKAINIGLQNVMDREEDAPPPQKNN
jgi:hypothetical protein